MRHGTSVKLCKLINLQFFLPVFALDFTEVDLEWGNLQPYFGFQGFALPAIVFSCFVLFFFDCGCLVLCCFELS